MRPQGDSILEITIFDLVHVSGARAQAKQIVPQGALSNLEIQDHEELADSILCNVIMFQR